MRMVRDARRRVLMAKALKTVGIVVGAVALIATGIGAVAGAETFLGVAGSTFATIGTIASVAAGAIGILSAVAFKPKFNSQGNPLRFTTNPQSGIPYCIGRTRMSGLRIHGDTTDGFSGKTKNDILAFAVELSGGGQIDSIEKFTADNELVTFDGAGNAIGRLHNYMAQKVWTGGAMTSALALTLGTAAMPGWTSAHELSGHTHALWMLRYETDGSKYGAGPPEPAWIGKWVKVYDPRLDSTYPGGSGTHRSNDETTWEWSRNGALHALTWAIGRTQNGKHTLGIGAPIANIRVADFVEAANVAETNGWWCGGVEYSTDSKWDVLKRMLQSCGAVPTMTGAMIGCRVNTPRISVSTITSAHLLDQIGIAATKRRRDRFNTVIPRYRSEDHEWEVISGSPISVASYVTADGGTRIKEIDYPLVQHEVGQAGVDGNAQVGQLAAYDIVNSREAGPISFTTLPQFIGLKTGDCVTLDVPEEGLSSQKVILTSVSRDPATGKISFEAETETDSKHAFALGQSTTPPTAFALSAPDPLPPDPDAADWTLTAATGADGMPFLHIAGSLTAISYDDVVIQYRKVGAASWSMWGSATAATTVLADVTGVDGATDYEARVIYSSRAGLSANWLTLASVTTATSAITNLQTAVSDALAYAQSRGKFWTTATPPTTAQSEVGDTWQDPADGTWHERVAADGITIGGNEITIGGNSITAAWTLSANQAVRDALATANSAYDDANDAIDQLIGLADDGIISVNEKITKLIPDQAKLAAKYALLVAQAGGFGVSTTAAASAKTAWDSYLAGLSPAWNDITADSPALRNDFDDARDAFDAALYNLDVAIKAKASTLATWSGVSGTGKPADNATRNELTVDDTEPSSPIDGDLWVDTSGTYVVFKLRSGGAWTTGANALSAYNALTGKPIALADINTTESTKLSGIQAGATVGAPSGTNVGSTPATTIEAGGNAANNGVNADGTIKDDKVASGAMQPNSATLLSASKNSLTSKVLLPYPVGGAPSFQRYSAWGFSVVKQDPDSDIDVYIEVEYSSNNDLCIKPSIVVLDATDTYEAGDISPSVTLIVSDGSFDTYFVDGRSFLLPGISAGTKTVYVDCANYSGAAGYDSVGGNMYFRPLYVRVFEAIR